MAGLDILGGLGAGLTTFGQLSWEREQEEGERRQRDLERQFRMELEQLGLTARADESERDRQHQTKRDTRAFDERRGEAKVDRETRKAESAADRAFTSKRDANTFAERRGESKADRQAREKESALNRAHDERMIDRRAAASGEGALSPLDKLLYTEAEAEARARGTRAGNPPAEKPPVADPNAPPLRINLDTGQPMAANFGADISLPLEQPSALDRFMNRGRGTPPAAAAATPGTIPLQPRQAPAPAPAPVAASASVPTQLTPPTATAPAASADPRERQAVQSLATSLMQQFDRETDPAKKAALQEQMRAALARLKGGG